VDYIVLLSVLVGLALVLWILVATAIGNPIRLFRRRIFSTFLMEHLAAITRLRLPWERSLDACGARLSRGSQRDLRDVSRNLNEGLLLGDALALAPRSPGNLVERFRRLVEAFQLLPPPKLVTPAEAEVLRVGEMSGDLERAFNELLKSRRRFGELRAWMYAALLYPIAVLLVLFGVISGVLTFIVPKFKMIFFEFDAPLPVMSLLVTDVADFVKYSSYWMFPLLLLAIFIISRYSRLLRPLLRKRRLLSDLLQRAVYLLPFVHGSMRRMLLAEFCRELAMLLRVGTPVPRALRVIAEGTMNPWFRDRARRAAKLCESGIDPGAALDRVGLDHRAGWFARAAANTLDLADALHRLANDYLDHISWTASVALRLLPPIVIVCVGALVGFIVIGLFSPLVALVNLMGG